MGGSLSNGFNRKMHLLFFFNEDNLLTRVKWENQSYSDAWIAIVEVWLSCFMLKESCLEFVCFISLQFILKWQLLVERCDLAVLHLQDETKKSNRAKLSKTLDTKGLYKVANTYIYWGVLISVYIKYIFQKSVTTTTSTVWPKEWKQKQVTCPAVTQSAYQQLQSKVN